MHGSRGDGVGETPGCALHLQPGSGPWVALRGGPRGKPVTSHQLSQVGDPVVSDSPARTFRYAGRVFKSRPGNTRDKNC